MFNLTKNLFITILTILLSIFIGFRSVNVGKDTEAYQSHFNNATIVEGIYDRFELGFALFMQLFAKSGLSVELFFTFTALIITFVYTHVFITVYSKCFANLRPNSSEFLIYFSLMLISSWYYAATTNGLRHGMSLVFVYWSCLELFYYNKKLKFIVLLSIAISFHFTALFVAPFLLFYSIRFIYVFIIWFFLACGFILGLNEFAVKFLSNSLNLPLYELIKYYSLEKGLEEKGGGLWAGFILSFFIYTIFWPLLLLILLKVKIPKKTNFSFENIQVLLKLYLFLSMIYFVLGFGPYSNRYAFFAWFLIPIIQTVSLCLIFNFSSKKELVSVLFFISIVNFLYFKLEWINFIW